MSGARLRCACIGYGYWGKNIARVLQGSRDFALTHICDAGARQRESAAAAFPHVTCVTSVDELPLDQLDVIAIVTPADTHYPLAKAYLEAGKHVLVTKPFTRTYAQAEELVAIARRQGVCVFVDHTFVFNPAVRTLKELLPRVGTPYLVIGQRLNLGLFQPDVNVIYDLMPHDISIVSYLLDRPIRSASTSAFRAAGLEQEDVAHSTFELADGIKGLITVSWLAPAKIRQFIVVGSDGMIAYDDVAVSEKVRFYDRGISYDQLSDPQGLMAYTTRISYRSGDMFSPALPNREALADEMVAFAESIRDPAVRDAYDRLNLDVMFGLQQVVDGLTPSTR